MQQDAADPGKILLPHRPVEAEGGDELIAGELVGADVILRQHHVNDAAGHEADDDEDDQAGEEQRGNQRQ